MSNYVLDSLKITREYEDSIFYNTPFFLSKDTIVNMPGSNYLNNTSLTVQVSNGHEGIKRPFTLEGDDGIFALLLVCFVFFTRIFKGGFTFFKENIGLLFSSRKNLNLFSETTTTEFWFNFILVFQTILLISIILFDSFLESISYDEYRNSFVTVLLFTFTITVFLTIKYLFYKLMGYLFEIQVEIKAWLRSYMIVLEMLGIIAFIPALMLVYSQSFHQYLLFFFFILFFVSRLILFYRIITFFFKRHVNLLFLITYLCGVEIIPYILLYQVLVYLYKVDIVGLLWL